LAGAESIKAAKVAIAAAGIIDFRIFLSLIEFRLYLLPGVVYCPWLHCKYITFTLDRISKIYALAI
jgi:hypothetical protein